MALARKKTTQNSFDLSLPPAALYREDLEAIANYLTKVSDKVAITADDYQLDDVDDLANTFKGPIQELEFRAGSWDTQHLSVKLYGKPYGLIQKNAIRGNDEQNPTLLGVTQQIAAIVERRKPFSSKLTSTPVFFTAALLIGVLLPQWGSLSHLVSLALGALLLLIMLGYFVSAAYNRLLRAVGIYPFYRSERAPNFFQRKKDDLLADILTGAVLIIMSLALGFLIGRTTA